jgi:hypothetical protein
MEGKPRYRAKDHKLAPAIAVVSRANLNGKISLSMGQRVVERLKNFNSKE